MRRIIQYVVSKTPSREVIQRLPILRPVAHKLEDPNLWHLNRRSVTRGVGVGLFFAILIPIAHTAFAVVAAIPMRANAIVSVGVTWAVNPFTLPPLILGAHRLGAWIMAPETGVAAAAAPVGWLAIALHWLATTGIGLAPLAVLISAGGAVAVRIGWDMRTRLRWARRSRRRAANGA